MKPLSAYCKKLAMTEIGYYTLNSVRAREFDIIDAIHVHKGWITMWSYDPEEADRVLTSGIGH